MRSTLLWAALAVALAAGWQALTVHYNYGGDWSALFDTGAYTAAPPEIAVEGTYRFADSQGYDGQYYHFVAHDPLLRRDTARYVDNPRLRWRRILLPALAFLAVGGAGDRVDSAYGVMVLAFVFLGAWWLGVWSVRAGRHAAWALAFLAVPAVAVSLDRYTVDVALAALAVGFAVHGAEDRSWRMLVILALAPLARETGAILIAAYLLCAARRRDWRAVGLAAAAVLPYAAWLLYLAGRTAPDQTVWASWVPFAGLLARTLHPIQHSTATRWLREAAAFEYLGVLAMWLAVVLAGILLWKRKQNLVTVAAALFAAVFVAFLGQAEAWSGIYSFGRTMSPLLIWLGLAGLSTRAPQYLAPAALMLPRIVLQLEPQWKGITR